MPRVNLLLHRIRAATIALAFLAGTVSASDEESSREGGYVGIGFGYGFEQFDRNDASNVDDAVGLNAWLGYRLSDFWATETQIEYLRGFDLTIGGSDGDGGYILGTVNAKLFPLARVLPSRIDPFVFLGLGGGRFQVSAGPASDVEEVSFLMRFGAGFDVYVLEDLAIQISASFVQPTLDLGNFAYVSTVAGVQYRF